jgi:hypothetical protein
MDVDTDIASPSAPGSKAASPAPSTAAAAAEAGHKQPATPAAPASAAAAAASGAAAQQQPETPAAAAKADAAAEVPSAVKSTAGKAAAQVLLTPEQRTQLLEQCQQVIGVVCVVIVGRWLGIQFGIIPRLLNHLSCTWQFCSQQPVPTTSLQFCTATLSPPLPKTPTDTA